MKDQVDGCKANNHEQNEATCKYLFKDLGQADRDNKDAYGHAGQSEDEFGTVHELYAPVGVGGTRRISE
jgi:hypothetical protein